MTTIHWRKAVPGDEPALAILGGATFLASFAHNHPGSALVTHICAAHSEAYYRAALSDPAQVVLIGETPLRAPVGYAMLTPPNLSITIDPGRDVELKRLYLLSGWHGSGHGDTIMELMIEQARLRGARRVLLAVYPQNAQARRFYVRHGFGEIGETTFMVGDMPFRDLIYARTV